MSEELKNENIEEETKSCCGHSEEEEHEHAEHAHHHDYGGHEHHHGGEGHEHHHHEEEHEHHHHDHDDDDECCGHDHHHHHHDDDDECCGEGHDHEHHHDHGHTYDVPGYSLVETHLHEGATVCSFEKTSLMGAEEGKTAMEESILELEHWLEAEGALIGHVKGYIKSGGTTTTFSTVGNAQGLNMSEHASAGLTIGFASIVFGPSEEELKDKVVEVFERLK